VMMTLSSLLVLLFCVCFAAEAAKQSYTLVISRTTISADGYPKHGALLVNNSLPAPLLVATEGDDFEILVINKADQPTAIHWHGFFQSGTNDQDGVPFVTQCLIPVNSSKLYKFSTTTQSGLYWYHSHFQNQLSDGLRGPILVRPSKSKPAHGIKTYHPSQHADFYAKNNKPRHRHSSWSPLSMDEFQDMRVAHDAILEGFSPERHDNDNQHEHGNSKHGGIDKGHGKNHEGVGHISAIGHSEGADDNKDEKDDDDEYFNDNENGYFNQGEFSDHDDDAEFGLGKSDEKVDDNKDEKDDEKDDKKDEKDDDIKGEKDYDIKDEKDEKHEKDEKDDKKKMKKMMT